MSEGYRRIEYGVIQDRTASGLGRRLWSTHRSQKRAEEAAADLRRAQPDHPVGLKWRLVYEGDWEPMPTPVEHVGGCNEQCRGDGHYLAPDPATPTRAETPADRQETFLERQVSSRTPAATRGSGHVRSRPSQHTQSTQATRAAPSSEVEEQGHMTQPGNASATRSPEATRITVAVDSVLADGRALLADEGVLDSVWVDDLAAVVIDALMSSRSDQVSALELALSTFDAELRARGDQPEPVVAQVGLLRRVAQLGAQSLTPREVARTIEPNSHAARLLMLLAASTEEMFSDALAEELELHPTQLSRIFKSLTSHGLVQRIKYGRRASWSLTPAGQIAANQVRERDVQPAPQDLVVAATPEEFEDAVHRSVDALEIDAPNEGAWYLRAVLDRMTGDEIFGSEHMPLLVFPKSSACDAYVRSDVARTFTRLLGSGGVGGLTITGFAGSGRFTDERAEERSTNDGDELQPGTSALDSADCAGVS